MVGKRYRIIETLGKGAFGTVYRAEVLGAGDFKKQVALKVLDYQGEAPEEIALRFRDEARILGLIRHRAVVGVDSLAELESGWAVVMEYVHGVNVSAVVKYGLPPARVVVAIVEEVASALHAAWTTVSDQTGEALRLVHRDIKPANVRITAQGEVKVLDFGVARAEFASREAHTQAMRFGSLRYMAPEAFDGIEGHATDVFALGVVMGELLAGKRLEEPPKNPERFPAFLDAVEAAGRARLEPTMEADQLDQVVALMRDMIAFEPEDRPSGRAVERACRELTATLSGSTLRDWAEDYIPALAEKIARRQAQRDAGEPPTSEILVEKSAGQVVEGSLPPYSGTPTMDGTETRANSTAALGGAMLGAGVTMVGIGVVVLLLFALGWYLLAPPELGGVNDGVAQLDVRPDENPEPRTPTEGTDLDVLEGLPKTEYFEVVDPDDPNRTIVIARGDVRKGEVEGTIEIVDPEDPRRTIVIAKRSVTGRAAPPEGDTDDDPKTIEVPAPAPEPAPTKAEVPRPGPAPAPAPAPAPSPTPQPMASGGSVAITGDAKAASFVSDGGRFGPGTVPVGTYRIMADFGNGEIQAGTVTVRDGEAVRVDCQSLMLRCSRR